MTCMKVLEISLLTASARAAGCSTHSWPPCTDEKSPPGCIIHLSNPPMPPHTPPDPLSASHPRLVQLVGATAAATTVNAFTTPTIKRIAASPPFPKSPPSAASGFGSPATVNTKSDCVERRQRNCRRQTAVDNGYHPSAFPPLRHSRRCGPNHEKGRAGAPDGHATPTQCHRLLFIRPPAAKSATMMAGRGRRGRVGAPRWYITARAPRERPRMAVAASVPRRRGCS